MNIKSQNIKSLFREMNHAMKQVLGENLKKVNYMIIDKEIVQAIQD